MRTAVKSRLSAAILMLTTLVAFEASATQPCGEDREPNVELPNVLSVSVSEIATELCLSPEPWEVSEFKLKASANVLGICKDEGNTKHCSIVLPEEMKDAAYVIRNEDGAPQFAFTSEAHGPVEVVNSVADLKGIPAGQLRKVHLDTLEKVADLTLEPIAKPQRGYATFQCYSLAGGKKLSRESIYVLHVAPERSWPWPRLLVVGSEPPRAVQYQPVAIALDGACPPHAAYILQPSAQNYAYSYRWRVWDESQQRVVEDWEFGLTPLVSTFQSTVSEHVYIGGKFNVEVEAIDTTGRASARTMVPVQMDLTSYGCSPLGRVAEVVKHASLFFAVLFTVRWGLKRIRKGERAA